MKDIEQSISHLFQHAAAGNAAGSYLIKFLLMQKSNEK